MPKSRFSIDGAVLELTSKEYTFIFHALSYVLYGIKVPDFQILMEIDRESAERFLEELSAQENLAKKPGEHWLVKGAKISDQN